MAERLPDKLQRLLLEEETAFYADRERLLSSNAAARTAAPAPADDVFLAPHSRAEAPESRLPDSLLLRILSFCPAEDLCRATCVSKRWQAAGENEKLWKSVCRSTINHFHPEAGPLGSRAALRAAEQARAAAAAKASGARPANPLLISAVSASLDPILSAMAPPALRPLLSPTPISAGTVAESFPPTSTPSLSAASTSSIGSILPPETPSSFAAPPLPALAPQIAGAGVGEAAPAPPRQEVSLSLARQRQLDLEAAREAKAQAEREAYKAARDLMIAVFKSSVLAAKPAPSYRAGFKAIALLRMGGFYSLTHRYIRTPLIDAFHKVDGILTVVYHRSFRFLPDGRVVYVMTNGKTSDVVKSFRSAFPLLDKHCPPNSSLSSGMATGGAFDAEPMPASAGAGSVGAGGAGAVGGRSKLTAKEQREAKEEKERLRQNLGFGTYSLWGNQVRVKVALANTVTHWTLTVSSSPAFYEDERVYASGSTARGMTTTAPSAATTTAGSGTGTAIAAAPAPKPAIPEGWMDRLTVESAILCEYGATLEQGSALASLEGEEYSFTPLDWSRV